MNAFGIESMPDLPSAYQCERIREAAGLSEEQLAAMVGVSDLSIRIWEAGVEEPSGMWRLAYSKVLAALMERSEDDS